MTLAGFSVREDWVMPEYKRYNLTLRVVDPTARDKFRRLSRPESFFEIRPNRRPGQRGAYSVEMTQSEYEAALEDAQDPDSNLISIEPVQRMYGSESVPGTSVTQYAAMQDADSLGLTGSGVVVGLTEQGYGDMLDMVFSGRIKAAQGFGTRTFEDGSSESVDPRDTGSLEQPTHGAHMASLAVPSGAQIAAGAYNGQSDAFAAMLYWLADEVGVDIISNSQHLDGSVEVVEDAIDNLVSKNVIMFSAAGNGGLDNIGDGDNTLVFPGSYNKVYTISNYRPSTDSIASTSNFGSGDEPPYDNSIWAASPGCEVYFIDPDGSTAYDDDSGTSAATAVAAGIAARFMTGGRSPGNVVSYLASNARPTGASPLYEGAGVLQLSAAEQQLQQDQPEKIDLAGAPMTGTDGEPLEGAAALDGAGDPAPGACD